MDQNIQNDIRFLKWYAAGTTVIVLYLFITKFLSQTDRLIAKELNVERINIVEESGELKMVISNMKKQHPGMVNGKSLAPRQREAGIIFFNSSGDECGGLVYDGNKESAGLALSVDQFHNDQIMQLQYAQEGTGDSSKRHYGLKIWDRSDKFTLAEQVALVDSLKALNQEEELNKRFKLLREKGLLGSERMFAGKNQEGEVGLFIRDDKGRIRIKIFCDNQNNPKMILLNEEGAELAE